MKIAQIRDLYPFKSHFHKIKDYNFHYIDEGAGNTILMLHGNPSWSFMYRRLIADLSLSNRVVVPDHLGCGLSDKPQDYFYRLETHIDNLESLVLDLELENITLIVHDWGGAIGMGLAVRYPQRIKRLIILNSAAFSIDAIPWRLLACKTPWLGEFLIRRLNLFCLAATHMTTKNKLDHRIAQAMFMPYDNYEDRVAVNRFVQDIPMKPEDTSYELLLEIEHGLWMLRENPVCIVWGMCDWVFTPVFLRKWMMYYPQADVLQLPDAGHYLLEDDYEEARDFIKNFLAINAI